MSSFCIIYQFRKILHILRNNFRLLLVIFCRDHEIEFYLSRETLSAEIFRTKNTFLLFLGFETKKLGLLAKILRHFFKNAFEVSRGKIQEIFCFETSGFNNLFEIWLKKIRTFIKKLPTRLSTSPSSTPEDNLRKKKFQEIYRILIIFGLVAVFCGTLAQKVWWGSQKCLSLVHRNNLRKKYSFCKKCLAKFFLKPERKVFGLLTKTFQQWCWNALPDVQSIFSREFFQKKGLCYQFQALRG